MSHMKINSNLDGAYTSQGVTVVFLRAGSSVPVSLRMANDFRAFNAMIGADTGDCVRLQENSGPLERTALWVDDEGLNNYRPTNVMASRLVGHRIVGDALVVAHNRDGECVDLEVPTLLAVADKATRD